MGQHDDERARAIDALLDFGRAARRVTAAFPEIAASDLLQHVSGPAEDWALTLLEMVLDYEDRHAAFWLKWKRWRNRREFIKCIPRPNATYLGSARPRAKRNRNVEK